MTDSEYWFLTLAVWFLCFSWGYAGFLIGRLYEVLR
jgi:hypothetical protein